jgi:uncharacterized protein (DUF1800 family)
MRWQILLLGLAGITAGALNAQDIPATDAEAARFLTQATFGPTTADIARVRLIGYTAWINEQIAAPPTLVRPYIETTLDNLLRHRFEDNPEKDLLPQYSRSERINRWFRNAVFANDQLRQRVSFALSQIMVVGDINDNLVNDVTGVSEYQDILTRNSFGSYRTLLEDVTRSPVMGKYLTTLRNRSSASFGAVASPPDPDENYAREVMQLFSIGLIKRNLDFSPTTTPATVTYDQPIIFNLAKVFTGFTYTGATSGNFYYTPPYTAQVQNPNWYGPMSCVQNFHDTLQKTLFDGNIITAGQTCDQDLTQALNFLFNHQNVAPFISRQLIQRLVTSNPSPAYIGRVAAKFVNNGSGVRGDLGAVVKQILLDPEARGTPPSVQWGKVREPLLRLTALWRAVPIVTANNFMMGITNPETPFSQRPLGANTVFNFYEPDFRQPGDVANTIDPTLGALVSPELQIINETTVMNLSNQMLSQTWRGYEGFTVLNRGSKVYIDISGLESTLATGGGTALIDSLNLKLMYGSMSTFMRQKLIDMETALAAITPARTNTEKVLSALHVILISPEFSVQR